MTPMPAHESEPEMPNFAPPTPERNAMDWLLTDAFYNGRLSAREYNRRLRALWQQE